MLMAFLIRDRDDWEDWRKNVTQTAGKPIIHISDHAVKLDGGPGSERGSAVDEVEVLEEDDDEDDDVDVITISGSEV